MSLRSVWQTRASLTLIVVLWHPVKNVWLDTTCRSCWSRATEANCYTSWTQPVRNVASLPIHIRGCHPNRVCQALSIVGHAKCDASWSSTTSVPQPREESLHVLIRCQPQSLRTCSPSMMVLHLFTLLATSHLHVPRHVGSQAVKAALSDSLLASRHDMRVLMQVNTRQRLRP